MKNQVMHIIVPGESSGIKIVELANWTGKAFIVPRASLKDIKDRPEAEDPALYFLFGEADESTNQKLYIGESENFYDRLANHDANKDFWNFAVIFTGGLDKAKVRYLEYLATFEALLVGRFDLVNSASRNENSLKEYDKMSTKDFFDSVKFVLTVLGYPVFEHVDESVSDTKIYTLKAEGVDAKAQLLNDGSLNVMKGSLARIRETKAFWGWSLNARKRFLEDGTLIDNGDGISYKFTKDVLFKSPSAASSTTIGSPSNGWTAWKDEKGNTLDENLRK